MGLSLRANPSPTPPSLHHMGRLQEKHPPALREAIGNAIAEGESPRAVWEQLAAGTSPYWDGPYEIPLATVRYYGKREKQRRAALGLTELAKGDLHDALEQIARGIISEVDQALTRERKKKTTSLDRLAELADVAKKVQPLIRKDKPEPQKPRGKTSRARATDPLTARLASGITTDTTTPTPANSSNGHANGTPNENPSTQEHAPTRPPEADTTPQPHTQEPTHETPNEEEPAQHTPPAEPDKNTTAAGFSSGPALLASSSSSPAGGLPAPWFRGSSGTGAGPGSV